MADGGDVKMTGSLQARNAQFQAEIAAMDPMETEDPLDVYFRYICWLFEVFPQATGHQAVIKLVEKPLRLFREQERYRNDSRYIKMWIWYTGLVNEGQEAVFQFLLANNIGDSLAVLYEEYAKLLESRGKNRKADEMYQLGISRKAQPLVRLERRYTDFQRRIMAQTIRDVDARQMSQQAGGSHRSSAAAASAHEQRSRGVEDENHAPMGQHHVHAHARSMLGNKRSGGSVRSSAANALPQSQRGLPSQRDRGDSVSGRPNARISVFSDPDGMASMSSAAGQASRIAESASSGWLDIGTDEGRRKENMPEAASWRGQTFEQRRNGALPAGRPAGGNAPYLPAIEKFTVFCDEPSSDDTRPLADRSNGVLGQRGPADNALTASSSSLLHSFDASSHGDPRHGQGAARDRQHKEKPRERMVMPDSMLFPRGDGVPQCAEEARARLPRYAFDYDAWVRCCEEEEEERARLAKRRQQQQQQQPPSTVSKLRTAVRLNDDDDEDEDEDDGIADESGFSRNKRKSMGISSPTINTRVAQKGMLGIWNDMSDSDSDSESLLGLASGSKKTNGERQETAGRNPASANSSVSAAKSAVDDDYQFTMGPVTPHVVPEGQSSMPAMIPSSARPGSRFEAFLDRSGSQDRGDSQSQGADHAGANMDENDAPTVVLNSIRAARRQELRFSRAKPTPLATRMQTPVRSTPLADASLDRYRRPGMRGLRNISEDSEGFDDDDEGDDGEGYDDGVRDEHQLVRGNAALKTPMGERIQIFRDSPGNGGPGDSAGGCGRPEPLFGNRGGHAAPGSASLAHRTMSSASSSSSSALAPLGRQFEVARDMPLSAPAFGAGAGAGHSAMEASRHHGSFATPGRRSGLDRYVSNSARPASVSKSASASTVARFGQTPGYTRTATGYSISGAEFSALSGFTGISTIGGPSMLAHEQLVSDGGEDDHYTGNSEISHTPMRKRLSMAAKDLCKITPRFPKQMAGNGGGDDGGQYSGHGHASEYHDDDDDDDDEDEYEDADDGDDEPCTENIGEFADLDSQMNELQMQLGAQFARQPAGTPGISGSSGQRSGDSNHRNTPKKGVPLFEIFRD
ncbi:protein kinase [Coemansia sp. RSA 2598]|nr:protein kinase [Coemansia sp. RSA 2598]